MVGEISTNFIWYRTFKHVQMQPQEDRRVEHCNFNGNSPPKMIPSHTTIHQICKFANATAKCSSKLCIMEFQSAEFMNIVDFVRDLPRNRTGKDAEVYQVLEISKVGRKFSFPIVLLCLQFD